MNLYQNVYEENMKLDDLFTHQHQNDSTIIQMNIVELCVEIGELANETRCFKYWSQKKASEKNIILEEFADCFLMVLCFFHLHQMDLPESFEQIEETNINVVFQQLFFLASSLSVSSGKENCLMLFHTFIHLAHLLRFSHDDVIQACMRKIQIVKERLQTNY